MAVKLFVSHGDSFKINACKGEVEYKLIKF